MNDPLGPKSRSVVPPPDALRPDAPEEEESVEADWVPVARWPAEALEAIEDIEEIQRVQLRLKNALDTPAVGQARRILEAGLNGRREELATAIVRLHGGQEE